LEQPAFGQSAPSADQRYLRAFPQDDLAGVLPSGVPAQDYQSIEELQPIWMGGWRTTTTTARIRGRCAAGADTDANTNNVESINQLLLM